MFGGCCLHLQLRIPLTLTLHPITAHAFSTSPVCSSFAKATVTTVVRKRDRHAGWRTQRSSTALSSLHSPRWPIHTGVQLSTQLLCTTCLMSVLWGPELNAHNMSSSVYLTLPVSTGASKVLNMNKNITFFNAIEQNIGCREDCLWQKLRVCHFCRSKRNISKSTTKTVTRMEKISLLLFSSI